MLFLLLLLKHTQIILMFLLIQVARHLEIVKRCSSAVTCCAWISFCYSTVSQGQGENLFITRSLVLSTFQFHHRRLFWKQMSHIKSMWKKFWQIFHLLSDVAEILFFIPRQTHWLRKKLLWSQQYCQWAQKMSIHYQYISMGKGTI